VRRHMPGDVYHQREILQVQSREGWWCNQLAGDLSLPVSSARRSSGPHSQLRCRRCSAVRLKRSRNRAAETPLKT
jgi:hypothetical protein